MALGLDTLLWESVSIPVFFNVILATVSIPPCISQFFLVGRVITDVCAFSFSFFFQDLIVRRHSVHLLDIFPSLGPFPWPKGCSRIQHLVWLSLVSHWI